MYRFYGEEICLEDTDIVFTWNNTHDGEIAVDVEHSKWGIEQDCHFLRYAPIMLAVCTSMWIILFAMCGHGGRGREL